VKRQRRQPLSVCDVRQSRRLRRRCRRLAACILALSLALPAAATGDPIADSDAAAAPASARDALPGLGRIAIIAPVPVAWSLAWTSGYGYTESVMGDSDAHHRVGGSLAASMRLLRELAVAIRLDGRYDRHTGVPGSPGNPNGDDGWIGDTRIVVRGGRSVAPRLHVGGEVVVWFPGERPMVPALDGTSVDLLGLAALSLSPALRVAVQGGARLDRSAESAPNADRLSQADRLALGISDSNAVLLGAGAGLHRGPLEAFAELSWDLLVGADAPAMTESPMRAGLGARYRLTDQWIVHAGLEVALSARPEVAAGKPLVPVEPRVAVTAGAIWQLGGTSHRRALGAGSVVERDRGGGTVRGRVLAPNGQPLAGVHVRAGNVEAVTDQDGRFELRGLPAGEVIVEIDAVPPYAARRTKVTVGDHAVVVGDVAVERALPPGQIRGVVRTMAGKPVAASVRVEPLDLTLQAGDDGAFRVDVPPGSYEVVITAPGLAPQRRRIQVDEDGVTVLNVELRGGRRN